MAMKGIQRSALVFHKAERMYALVNDVARYPEFIRGCQDAEVLNYDELSMTARLTVSLGGLRKSFTTCNRLEPGRSIELALLDGPFESLHGRWEFMPLGTEGSKVMLTLNYELSPVLLPFQAGFTRMADSLVSAFCQRADDYHVDDFDRNRLCGS
jgi:ribosome-associated toxin RatA of RatAB toxin-antitoxin module